MHKHQIIILENTSLNHPPVVTYFSRSVSLIEVVWLTIDITLKIFLELQGSVSSSMWFLQILYYLYSSGLKGSFSHCSLEMCTALWNPDVEEQRFCWECKSWFHTTCLSTNCITTQEQHLKVQFAEHSNVPSSILRIAFQPTARGGQLHYIAGNIRFVNKARLLLDHTVWENILSNPDPWMAANIVDNEEDMSSLWWEYMVYEYNIDVGNLDTEQLVVTDQFLYACPKCGPLTSL